MSWAETKKAINGTLGTSSFKPLDEILGGGIEKLKTGTVPIVRHIQRGVVTSYMTASGYNKLINVYPVTLSGFSNTSKMIAIFNGFAGTSGYYRNSAGSIMLAIPYASSLTTTQLNISVSENYVYSGTEDMRNTATFEYVVVEFY